MAAITHHVNFRCQHDVKHKVFGSCETSLMPLHPSAQRLFEAAKASHNLTRPSDIARALNVSEQAFGNWSKRGVSEAGAIAAERLFLASPNWILTGDGSMSPPWLTIAVNQKVMATGEPQGRWYLPAALNADVVINWLADRLDALPEHAQRVAQMAMTTLDGAPDSGKARAALIRAIDSTL